MEIKNGHQCIYSTEYLHWNTIICPNNPIGCLRYESVHRAKQKQQKTEKADSL